MTQRSQVVSAPGCKAEAFGIEFWWLHPLVLSESQQDEKSQFSEGQRRENKHLKKVYITKLTTDGASCVSEVLVCKYTKALLMMHHLPRRGIHRVRMLKKAWRAYGLCEWRKKDGVQKKKGLGTDYKGLISRRDTRQPSSKDAVTEPHLASVFHRERSHKMAGRDGPVVTSYAS